MLQFHIYPGGVKRILTFSFDDGFENDIRLISLFDKYNLKSTFHLNGKKLINKSSEEKKQVYREYENHEIACHTFSHGWPARMPVSSLVSEVINDRKVLEDIAGYPVTGMSYPSGSYNSEVITVMRSCGIEYSRTVNSTYDFSLPEDFLEWNPTCHFKDAEKPAESFLNDLDSQWAKPLFYIWGHSHELKTENDWSEIERMFELLSGNDKIWYATNMEIYNYITAQKILKVSMDEKMFYNPTSTDVWVERDKTDIIKIPAGKKVIYP